MSSSKRSVAGGRQSAGGLRRLVARKRGRRRGATIVEFALVFIVFLVVVFALMEFGRLMWTYSTLAHVTRQVGRFSVVRGSVNPATTSEIQAVVDRHSNSTGLDSSQVVVSMSWNDVVSPASIERGDFVEVQLTYPFQFVTGSLIVPNNTLQLGSTCRMVVAN